VKILLDTCTFLWLTLDAPALSPRARQLLGEPDPEVYLSPVSAWEISVKHTLGRLPLPAPPAAFVPAQRQGHGVLILPLEETAALQEASLPRLHKDPFDRLLICQAIVHDLVILTPDSAIRRYPPVRTDW
jgi:PIN domain nuclease of toxin-antitoxin system